ncbi:hypothetical protein [Actinoplanes sp. URMC 104]|uniref:hypothetical protein n=1 Tax=Actinoplanes sp. URMC 104 TaxID=3423409 RepID=UPI003F1C312A
MTVGSVLDAIETLIRAAQHPDIADVYRYTFAGEQAVGIVYQSGAKAFIWPVKERTAAQPADLPDALGDYKPRVRYVLRMLTDLLELTKPEGWQWRVVAIEGVGSGPCALELRVAGQTVLLRVTSGGAPAADSDPADWAGWTYPDGVAAALG